MNIESLDPELRKIAGRRAAQQGTDFDDLLQEARLSALEQLAAGETEKWRLLGNVWDALSWDQQVARSAVIGVPVSVPVTTIRAARRGDDAVTDARAVAVADALTPAALFDDQMLKVPELDDTQERVDVLLDQLPELERRVLELHMAGFSERELAAELSLKRTRTQDLLRSARALTAELLVG